MEKNQQFTARVDGLTSEGLGVVRLEGRAVFVKGAIPGELCRILITKVGKTAVYGRLMEVLEPSAHRVTPDCPYYGRCGGCDFRHMDYALESALKAQRVAETLRRIGGVEPGELSICAAENTENYRNKAVYPVRMAEGRPQAGFFRARSHELIGIEHCRIQNASADAARRALLKWMEKYHISPYDEEKHHGYVRNLFVRTADKTDQVLVCVVANTEKLPRQKELIEAMRAEVPGLTTLVHGVHTRPGNAVLGERFVPLWGEGWIEDELCGLKFRISAPSFYQVNRDQAEKLYKMALEKANLTGKETVLDLYCGTGTITLCLAQRAGRAVGVEIIPAAIADAKGNAARNGIENAEFFCADAGEAARRFADAGEAPDVIVVDPPRKGLSPDVIEAIDRMSPRRVVYVSCDPATLARDVKLLIERGFRLESAEAADLFPRCAHVESVLALTR